MKLIIYITFIFLLSPFFSLSNEIILEGDIKWNDNLISKIDDQNTKTFLSFSNAQYDIKKDFLGFYSRKITLNQENIVRIDVIDIQYENVEKNKISNVSGFDYINNDINMSFINGISKKIHYGEIVFTPIIYNSRSGNYKRVISYKVKVITQKGSSPNFNNKVFNTALVLILII
jgi:hypothetical protein